MIEDGEESDEEANQSTEVRFIPSQKEHCMSSHILTCHIVSCLRLFRIISTI